MTGSYVFGEGWEGLSETVARNPPGSVTGAGSGPVSGTEVLDRSWICNLIRDRSRGRDKDIHQYFGALCDSDVN